MHTFFALSAIITVWTFAVLYIQSDEWYKPDDEEEMQHALRKEGK